MEKLIAAQRDMYGRIARSYDNLKKAGSAKITAASVRAALALLENKWAKFEAQHAQLRDAFGDELAETSYVTEDYVDHAESTYLSQHSLLRELERTLSRDTPSETVARPAVEHSAHGAFPRIDVPQFSGEFEDWPAFRDLFSSMVVDEPALSTVRKLHYLKKSVRGEADRLIRNIPCTGDNFERAWDIISTHFENTRLLVRSYLSAFYALPRMKTDSLDDLRRIYHGAVTTATSLEGVGRPVDPCPDFFVHFLVELLDSKTRLAWETTLKKSVVPPSSEALLDFLHEQLLTRDIKPSQVTTGKSSDGASRSSRSNVAGRRGTESSRGCPLCRKNHYILVCEQYKGQTALGRRDLVITHRLCMNCLGRHQVADCPSQKVCNRCSSRHHSSLHDAFASAVLPVSGTAPAAAILAAGPPSAEGSAVLLATARVLVLDKDGARHSVRALVDSGSESCMVAESLAQRLRLPRTPASVAIYGIGGQHSGVARGRVSLTVASRTSGSSFGISALVFPRLTIYSGTAEAASRSWAHLEGLELADPDYFSQDPVELLLGADAYAHIALPGLHRGAPHEPIAQQTQLGWILLGAVGAGHSASVLSSLQCSPCDDLPALVRRFWEQEEPPRAPLPLTEDEQECEDHFAATHSRAADGRYLVRLPFRGEPPNLTATGHAAARMLSAVERRFLRDRIFRDRYCAFMAEYDALGHMSKADPLLVTIPRRGCFLPHHGVLRGSGSEAKMRVVFNGSSPVADGSLNAWLHAGPNLLPSLADVITRWRRHRYVISTDIEKMYRQVRVHPDDRDWQRILWREGEIRHEYRLNTVTYGLASAPYLAMRVLRQLAADEGGRFPLGSAALTQDTYMDDIVSGASTLELARCLRTQLEQLCMAGGFPLRKWSANHVELLEGIPLGHRAGRGVGDFLPTEDQAVLGLRWDPDRDCFALRVQGVPPTCATKRTLLSGTAKLFDPLGWIAPVVVAAKILFQATWLQQLDWDDPLPCEDATAWAKLETELPLLEEVRVPRWLHCDVPDCSIEIHGFSDASERAFAAVVYLRVDDAGQVSTSLLMAKTKVAPLKQVSLPRLELCAATLLARLAAHVVDVLQLKAAPMHLWTDSTVTLGWIRGHPTRWTTFVANRVADIQRTVANGQWHHVPGPDNPADCASRGMSPRELLAHQLWWRGPDFLLQNRSQWPIDCRDASPPDLPEQRRAGRCLATSEAPEPEELTRFSSLRRLLRVTAWMLRWRRRVTETGPESPDGDAVLSPEELEAALRRWWRLAQSWAYPAEIESLKGGRPSPRQDSLRRLNPLLDDEGLLRVGGRIKHSLLSTDQRHPIILPPDSHLAHLIVDDCHRRTLHGGVQATLTSLRQRYWLPRGRQLVRRCVHRCPTCVRWRAASPQPPMGSLPGARITPSRPFLHTGVDFAGPILLRTTRGRGHKAYKAFLSVFVCFSSRAIHLEVVSDYTAEAFLAALRRFMARRGLCHTIYSDCGTNFVGADSQLRALFLPASQEVHRIVGRLAVDGVRWRFNPPAAPHFGGLWEAGVKAVKHHLRRVIGETTLTFEEMSTFLAEVEACLNSRPLQALSDDPEDLEVLTPGHFLIGAPLNAVPEPSLLDVPANRLSRWRLLQGMRDHWWHRWAQEYVQSLIPRPKWWSATRDLKEGQLCLLRSENTPPSRWPLARIVRRYVGDDGEVRVVEVRTRGGLLKRPVVKLVPLPSFDAQNCGGPE